MKCSIFDHHTDCGALTGSAVVTAAQMWRLLGAHSMARNHPDMSAPAFTRVVLDSVGFLVCNPHALSGGHCQACDDRGH